MYLSHFLLALIVSRFVKADEGNDDREHVEDLAKNTAERKIVYVMHDPERRNEEKLNDADGFAVARPHGERTDALREEEEKGDPPLFA